MLRGVVPRRSLHPIQTGKLMQRDIVTVERFYTENAKSLQLKLVAGAKG
jgi:hypothetical protein